jgi:hypothetical protein
VRVDALCVCMRICCDLELITVVKLCWKHVMFESTSEECSYEV